jgi:hypothetical protein
LCAASGAATFAAPLRLALELLVTAVACHAIAAVFATAEIDSFRFFCLVFSGGEFGTFVAAIAKWLSCALAASAIPIALARFHINGKWRFLGYMGSFVCHVDSSVIYGLHCLKPTTPRAHLSVDMVGALAEKIKPPIRDRRFH